MQYKIKPLTLIIAEHNEGKQLNDTLDSILDTSDHSLYDIIVVSDCSTVKLDLSKYKDLVKHTNSSTRLGVGASFDVGGVQVETPFMVTMGSDIRFMKNDYIKKMLDVLEDSQKSLVCVTNIGINKDRMDIEHPKSIRRYGARILFFMKVEDLPKNTKLFKPNDPRAANYRNILEAKWIKKQEGNVCELPCIFGAFYGMSTEWYKYIKGYRGHRYWGSLEPYISLKSWFAGGDCKIANDIEVAHIFKQRPSHVTHTHDLLYNKLFMSEVFFPKKMARVFISFLGDNEHIRYAKRMVLKDHKSVEYLRKYHESIFVRDLHWFYEKFPFKYYELIKDIK